MLEHQIGFLEHGLGLAGEGRLAQPQVGLLQQAGISGHPIARLKADQVAGNQVLAADPLPRAVAAHLHQGLGHVAERQQGLLGLALLQVTQQTIQHHDHQDRDGVLGEFFLMNRNGSGDGRHGQQHDQHHVAELVAQDLPGAATGRKLQPVGSALGQASGTLGCIETLWAHAETVLTFDSAETMPGGGPVGSLP